MQKAIIPFVPRCSECLALLPYQGAKHTEHPECSRQQGVIPQDSVEWTVYSLYAASPTLFGRTPWSRWFIFNHLFFTIGNRYEWYKGDLIDEVSRGFSIGEEVTWRSLEEKEGAFLESHPLSRAKATPRKRGKRELIEEANQNTLTMHREEWSQFAGKPQKWYPLCEWSHIFSVPENVSMSWLLAACDASQMFLQGSSEKQSLRHIYKLIEQRTLLFQRVGLVAPDLDETRMTSILLDENR